MTDIKISQLSNVSSMIQSDLFEISRSLGGGNWESHSVRFQELLHGSTGEKTITVGTDLNAQFQSIKAALLHAVSLTPSEVNPIVVQVFPGAYYEDNPLTIPSWVTLRSTGSPYSCGIQALNSGAGEAIIIAEGNSYIYGFTLHGVVGGDNIAYKQSVAATALMYNCTIVNVNTGILVDGGSVIVTQTTALGFFPPFDTAFSVINGGFLNLTNVAFTKIITGATYGMRAEGTDSRIFVFSSSINGATNGVYCDDAAQIRINGSVLRENTNSLRIGPTNDGSISAIGVQIENSATYSVLIESATGIIDFSGKMNYDKRSIVSGGVFRSYGINDSTSTLKMTGETNIEEKTDIGVPGSTALGLGVGLDVGEGGSYNTDRHGSEIVEYWSYDASVASGSRFATYTNNAGTQLTDNGDAIIVGSKYPFSTVRLGITTAANLGGNSIITEHWNGASWEEDGVCAYKKSDMTHRANVIFQNVETQYVEFGLGITDDWAADKNVLDEIPNWNYGSDMYPVRFRNNGGSLTTAMVFQNGKVRGDDFDVSEALKVINWGRYRQTNKEFLSMQGFIPNSTNPPAEVVMDISPNITGPLTSLFTDGNVCASSFMPEIPQWVDTSSTLVMEIHYYPSNSNVGNVNFMIRYLPIIDDVTVFDGTNTEYTSSVIDTTSGVEKLLAIAQCNFDISSFSPGDTFVCSIERDATVGNPLDTYSGDVVIRGACLTWVRKRIT